MAISAHYCAYAPKGQLTLKTEILAFHNITCGHTGSELAAEMVKVLNSYEIAHKVGRRFFFHGSPSAHLFAFRLDRLRWTMLQTTIR